MIVYQHNRKIHKRAPVNSSTLAGEQAEIGMSSSSSPVAAVRSTCAAVVRQSKHVKISAAGIDAAAVSFLSVSGTETVVDLSEAVSGIEWDSSDWHYSKDVARYGPLTCQYIFVLDSLNFCFWPVANVEYDTLAVCLKRVLERDESAFGAAKLASMTEEELESWFPSVQIPLLSERVERLRELGCGLLDKDDGYDGLACNVVARAKNSAVQLVKLVLRSFQGFRDTVVYKGALVHFYKRAQILVGDVWAAYGRQTESSGLSSASAGSIYCFNDMDQLTMFADYRVPQLLRQMAILEYTEDLARSIDGYEEIAFGSDEETEIRAATVVAVEQLQQALVEKGATKLLVVELDWLLWQRGEAMKEALRPHHRTLTVYY